MKDGYDHVSFFYDRLSRVIFGDKLLRAQQHLLTAIMPADHLLIVGGGSGWILEAIGKLFPSGLTITYVDASPKMTALAREKNREQNKVTFIAAAIEDVQLSSDYDVVITPFLFDNFSDADSDKIFKQLNAALRTNGQWLYADFQNTNNAIHSVLLKSMYFFFGMLCGVPTSRLPDMEKHFSDCGYGLKKQEYFMNGFVASRVYVKKK